MSTLGTLLLSLLLAYVNVARMQECGRVINANLDRIQAQGPPGKAGPAAEIDYEKITQILAGVMKAEMASFRDEITAEKVALLLEIEKIRSESNEKIEIMSDELKAHNAENTALRSEIEKIRLESQTVFEELKGENKVLNDSLVRLQLQSEESEKNVESIRSNLESNNQQVLSKSEELIRKLAKCANEEKCMATEEIAGMASTTPPVTEETPTTAIHAATEQKRTTKHERSTSEQQTTAATTIPTTTTTGPDKVVAHGKYVFERFDTWLSYEDALSACQSRSASLVKVENEKMNDAVTALLSESSGGYYLDLIRTGPGRSWKWRDGSPVQYHNWKHNEGRSEKEKCACISRSGRWFDTHCSVPRQYVCMAGFGSGSVGHDNFTKVKEWVKLITSKLDIDAGNATVGVIQYSHYFSNQGLDDQWYIVTEIRIGRFRNYASFAEHVDRIRLQEYTTYTGHALRKAALDFERTENYGKVWNRQVMILLTDGKSDDSKVVPLSAQSLRDMGVITYVVGVGNYNIREIRLIANGNVNDDTRVYAIADFDDLGGIVASIDSELKSIGSQGNSVMNL